jgi:catechol 2,3-dioxygenase-like lactoylglutathione lyase family enzyme
MPVGRLDHINIWSYACEATKDFYVDVVGLTVGSRPSVRAPGYWLYVGDHAVIHLHDASHDEVKESRDGKSAVDHFAFRMSGFEKTRSSLDEFGSKYRIRIIPLLGDVQIVATDPNGIEVELAFKDSEVSADLKSKLASGPIYSSAGQPARMN